MVAIGVTPYGVLFCGNFAHHNPAAAGCSYIQMIVGSRLCGHFAQNRNQVFLNVFLCKEFVPVAAIDLAYSVFKPATILILETERGCEPAPVP